MDFLENFMENFSLIWDQKSNEYQLAVTKWIEIQRLVCYFAVNWYGTSPWVQDFGFRDLLFYCSYTY